MIRSNHVILSTCLLIMLVVFISCSTQRNVAGGSLPGWVDNPSDHYSKTQYLMAVGSGSTLKEAQQDAQGNLSRIFQAGIDASQELIDEFVGTSDNGQISTQQTTELLNVIRIGSQQDLINTKNLEFVKWDLIIDIGNKYSDRSIKPFMAEGGGMVRVLTPRPLSEQTAPPAKRLSVISKRIIIKNF